MGYPVVRSMIHILFDKTQQIYLETATTLKLTKGFCPKRKLYCKEPLNNQYTYLEFYQSYQLVDGTTQT